MYAGFPATSRRPAPAAVEAREVATGDRRRAPGVPAASWLLVARPGWCPIRVTARSATARKAKALTIRRRCGWWGKALRRQALRSCTRAPPLRRRARGGAPLLACGSNAAALWPAPVGASGKARGRHRDPARPAGDWRAAHSKADLLPGLGQRRGLRARARAGAVPFAGAAA